MSTQKKTYEEERDKMAAIGNINLHGEQFYVYKMLREEARRGADWATERAAKVIAEKDAELSRLWIQGYPDKVYASEWFIAKLKDGTRAVLKALPEEYSHDFKTADETYYTKDWVTKWMQFPDSNYIYSIGEKLASRDAEIAELKEREKKLLACARFYGNELNWDILKMDVYQDIEAIDGVSTPGRLARALLKELGR